jgi:hypothetical protein
MRSRHRKLPDWMRAASVAACFALVAVLLIALPALARQIVLKSFDEAIEVNTDGTFDVTETIEAQFIGSWHGIYRTIPTEYVTNEGLNYTLAIDDIRATDTDGHKLKVEQSTEGRNKKLKIWVPDAEDATHTIVIHYRVLDGIRFFADHDELYWNVTATSGTASSRKPQRESDFPRA